MIVGKFIKNTCLSIQEKTQQNMEWASWYIQNRNKGNWKIKVFPTYSYRGIKRKTSIRVQIFRNNIY